MESAVLTYYWYVATMKSQKQTPTLLSLMFFSIAFRTKNFLGEKQSKGVIQVLSGGLLSGLTEHKPSALRSLIQP